MYMPPIVLSFSFSPIFSPSLATLFMVHYRVDAHSLHSANMMPCICFVFKRCFYQCASSRSLALYIKFLEHNQFGICGEIKQCVCCTNGACFSFWLSTLIWFSRMRIFGLCYQKVQLLFPMQFGTNYTIQRHQTCIVSIYF